jgi:hypothetical protein
MSLTDKLKGVCKKISEILNYEFTTSTIVYGTLGSGYHIVHRDGMVEQVGNMGPFPLLTPSEKKIFELLDLNVSKKINYKK